MHAYSVSVYYTCTKVNMTWVEPPKMRARIKQLLKFIIDNKSHCFFDT